MVFLLGVPCSAQATPGTDPSAEGNTSDTSLTKWQALNKAAFCLHCSTKRQKSYGTRVQKFLGLFNQKCLPAQVFRYLLTLGISQSLNIGDTFTL